jgi:hypothetical protein
MASRISAACCSLSCHTHVPVKLSLTAVAAATAAGSPAGMLLPGIRTRARSGGQQPRMSENPGPVYPWPQPKQDAGGALAGVLGVVQKPFARWVVGTCAYSGRYRV